VITMLACDSNPAVTALPTTTLKVKRAIDIAGSAFGLILLSPLFVLIAVMIRMETPGPAFFRQIRVGLNGRPFRIYKFRSMKAAKAPRCAPLTVRADKRVTRLGGFLRRTKLDELPQLINVLAGDMSLVGPRPDVPEFMEFFSPAQRAVLLSMRPGMTDYAAILFRNESELLDQDKDPVAIYRYKILPIKFGYYERYSHEISAATDLRIILATVALLTTGHIPKMLGIASELQEPVSQEGHAAT
jgi:lipopolysaccharide/colanic/teichoic acid biosynthesis glycosyltransferase